MGKNELKTGIVLSYLALVLNTVISLLYTPFLNEKLGTSEFGTYTFVNSVVTNLIILDFGFGNAIVRYTAKYRAEENAESEKTLHFMFFILYCIIGLIAFVIGIVLTYNAGFIFKSLTSSELSRAKILMLIAVINISISFPLGLYGAIIQAYEKFIFLRAMNLARTILNPLSIVIVLIYGYKSITVMLVTTILGTALNIFNIFYFHKVLGKRIHRAKFDYGLLKAISTYSFFIFLNIIVDRLYWATDNIILGIFAGTTALAVYNIGSQLFNYYMQISTSIYGIFLPKVVDINVKNENIKPLSDLFIKVGRIQFIMLSFVLSGFIIFGREFISLWMGPGFSDSYYIALVVMVTSVIPLSQNIGISILQSKNMQAFRSICYIFIAILNVILSVILVKPFGAIGCAVATSLAGIAGQIIIMNIYYNKKIKLNIRGYWSNVLKLSGVALIGLVPGGLLNYFIGAHGVFILIVKMAVFSILFIAGSWLLGMNEYEKNMILVPARRLLKLQKDMVK